MSRELSGMHRRAADEFVSTQVLVSRATNLRLLTSMTASVTIWRLVASNLWAHIKQFSSAAAAVKLCRAARMDFRAGDTTD